MNNLTFDVMNLVVSIVCVVIARYVIPYIKLKIGKSALSEIEWWVDWAVNWAEQTCETKGSGTTKKKLVKEFIGQLLDGKKVRLTDDQIDVLIESAVRYMNNNSIIEFDSELIEKIAEGE